MELYMCNFNTQKSQAMVSFQLFYAVDVDFQLLPLRPQECLCDLKLALLLNPRDWSRWRRQRLLLSHLVQCSPSAHGCKYCLPNRQSRLPIDSNCTIIFYCSLVRASTILTPSKSVHITAFVSLLSTVTIILSLLIIWCDKKHLRNSLFYIQYIYHKVYTRYLQVLL